MTVGEILIRTTSSIESAGTRDASAADRVEGPYVAETYDVTIEQEWVVVHIRE